MFRIVLLLLRSICPTTAMKLICQWTPPSWSTFPCKMAPPSRGEQPAVKSRCLESSVICWTLKWILIFLESMLPHISKFFQIAVLVYMAVVGEQCLHLWTMPSKSVRRQHPDAAFLAEPHCPKQRRLCPKRRAMCVLAGVELFDNKAFEISNMEARLLNADRPWSPTTPIILIGSHWCILFLDLSNRSLRWEMSLWVYLHLHGGPKAASISTNAQSLEVRLLLGTFQLLSSFAPKTLLHLRASKIGWTPSDAIWVKIREILVRDT